MSEQLQHIAHCSTCGCRMDISAMEPYTNVVCPDCGQYTRVKCDLDHYVLTCRHAAGGMSMVFGAKDTTLHRDVAIKILNEKYSHDQKRMEEFEREAKITAALSHPHIVRVFTVGQCFGCYYIAMEMVSGENLDEKISKGGAISESELLPMAKEMISGLHAAKTAGLIHRDVKPGNILFDDGGRVKIVDFGLALITMGGTAKANEIWATPYYVPPEALEGKEEDFRSDIYALGATLYHALSGKPPISSDVKSTREVRAEKQKIPPLEKIAPWLNSATCSMVNKAMAFYPEDRFSSYKEMEQAWDMAFYLTKDGAEEPINSGERIRRRVYKKRTLYMALSFLLLCLAAGCVWIFVFKKEKNQVDIPSQPIAEMGENKSDIKKTESKLNIVKLLRVSHQLLDERKYREASSEFTKLAEHADVNIELSSWAKIEAVLAIWLNGDPEKSLTSLRKLKRQMHIYPDAHSSETKVLVETLSSLKVSILDQKIGNKPVDIIPLFAVALKKWELGQWKESKTLFEKVKNYTMPKESPFSVYQKIAEHYLSDYQMLQPWLKMQPVRTFQEGKLKQENLRNCLENLKTRGRAKFNIRMWQLRVSRQLKELPE